MPGIRDVDLLPINSWHSATGDRELGSASRPFLKAWSGAEPNVEVAVLRSIRNQANSLFSYSEFSSMYTRFNSSVMFGRETSFLYTPSSYDEIVNTYEQNVAFMLNRFYLQYGNDALTSSSFKEKLLYEWKNFSRAHTARSIRHAAAEYGSAAISYYYKEQGGYNTLNTFFDIQLNWLMTHTILNKVTTYLATNTSYPSVILMPLVAQLATKCKQTGEVPSIEFKMYPRAGILSS